MAQKNVYVKEDDLHLFDEVAAIHESGSLSPAIADALKLYIASKKGVGEIVIEIKIGEHVQKFLAKPIPE